MGGRVERHRRGRVLLEEELTEMRMPGRAVQHDHAFVRDADGLGRRRRLAEQR